MKSMSLRSLTCDNPGKYEGSLEITYLVNFRGIRLSVTIDVVLIRDGCPFWQFH
jgi:hypothetical protein